MPIDKSCPRNIQDIAINNNDVLANLYKHSLAILKVQDSLRLQLGPALAPHLYVANLGPDTITIYTDSQAWATKLRFQTSEIIRTAKKTTGLNGLLSVRIKVSPALIHSPSIPERSDSLLLSPSTARLLAKVAENIDDPALQTAILKLCQNK
jgi:hypothetical protein